jgi:hypothetical protein
MHALLATLQILGRRLVIGRLAPPGGAIRRLLKLDRRARVLDGRPAELARLAQQPMLVVDYVS